MRDCQHTTSAPTRSRRRGWSARAAAVPLIVALAGPGARALPGQAAPAMPKAYPSRPAPLPEAEEIALARSAAPAEVSGRAAVWVLRASGPAKAIEGTNGCTCMVSRDLHPGSLYPICYDQEATRTVFPRDLMELRLRVQGRSEAQVKEAIARADADGTLPPRTKPALVYMMSSRQMLFTSSEPDGRPVGAWHPHLMIQMPGVTAQQFGFGAGGAPGDLQLDHSGEPGAQLIVPVTWWADSAKGS
jgi:hypothetical protein